MELSLLDTLAGHNYNILESGTPQRKLGACFDKSRPVQTQPEQTCWIEATRLSGYDIGSVQERTRGCEASPLLYNLSIKHLYGAKEVLRGYADRYHRRGQHDAVQRRVPAILVRGQDCTSCSLPARGKHSGGSSRPIHLAKRQDLFPPQA
jgi:hypothetical protein